MWIWLSHTLREETEGYRGKRSLIIDRTSSIEKGDSSNSFNFSMNNHLGTHVDVPYHFLNNGCFINDYKASDWVFNHPLIINKHLKPGTLLTPELIENDISKDDNIDIIIIKTGFEVNRGQKEYWENGPGYSENLCDFFLSRFKSLKAFGFDSISLSSLKHRNEGRRAHIAFLSKNIRIFEDLKLSSIKSSSKIKKIIALPIVINGGDGAPCTIIAKIN